MKHSVLSKDTLESSRRTFGIICTLLVVLSQWRVEIASAFSYTQNKIRYSNAIAESINNQIKTITKAAYGYNNFERFRKASYAYYHL